MTTPGDRLAGDRVARDPAADQVHGLAAEPHQRARRLPARRPLEQPHRGGEAGRDHAAVAARSAGADRARLEQHGGMPALGQGQGRGQPGEAAADDADLGRRPRRSAAGAAEPAAP